MDKRTAVGNEPGTLTKEGRGPVEAREEGAGVGFPESSQANNDFLRSCASLKKGARLYAAALRNLAKK